MTHDSHSHFNEGKNITDAQIDYYQMVSFFKTLPKHHIFSIGDNEHTLIVNELFRGNRNKLYKPRQSAFKGFTNKDKSFTITVGHYATIEFDFDKNTVTWNVEEGNHSVSQSRAHTMAQLLFMQLNLLRWRKGEGGHLTYWDEYMSDDLDDDYCRESDETVTRIYG